MYMSESHSSAGAYTTQIDTADGETIPDETPIEIDACLAPTSHNPRATKPDLTPEDLKVLSTELNQLSEKELATTVDHERMALENNSNYVPSFTALELNKLVICLAVAMTKCGYDEDMDGMIAIKKVGQYINQSAPTLLAESMRWKDMPGMRPAGQDDRDYINPFDVMADKQVLMFTDNKGNRLTPDDLKNANNTDVGSSF